MLYQKKLIYKSNPSTISIFFDIRLSPRVDYQQLTAYNKAVADTQRLLILRVLARESFGVLELCRILDINQPALSHHLKVLSSVNLVETRRQGTSIFYRRALIQAHDPLRSLRIGLHEIVDAMPLQEEIECRTSLVHRDRRDQARQFFEKNAQSLRENQNQIADYRQYSECIESVLANEAVTGKVVEIGSGESDLVFTLHRLFESVTVIDNSEEMLDRTRRRLFESGISDIRLIEGELSESGETADMIVLNMVLHHLASPARFFEDAACHLNCGGRLLIIDLTAHEQNWTRDTCGDLWPGFDPEELDNWAQDAGLQQGQSAYLGLKNGFQVQVRTFQKQD